MRSTSCPILVGRDEERAGLDVLLAGAGRSIGGLVVLASDAGIGKTRLAEEARSMATRRGMRVAVGRAVSGGVPTPFRPLSEAVLAAFRSTGLPRDPQLDAFRGHLGRLIPDWIGESTAEPSTLLVGESIVRLLRAVDHDEGWLIVLEDLQWADADTLAVVEFLAGTLGNESVLCLATVRTDGTSPAGQEVLARLRARGARIVELAALGHDDVAAMTAACLGSDTAPAELKDFIRSQSEGAPLYVEELLAGLMSSGRLIDGPDGWTVTGALLPRATSSIAGSVAQRLTAMGPVAKSVLSAAAVIGRRFDWQLLGDVSAVEETAINAALHDAVIHQLVSVDEGAFVFRHGLIRQAVLDGLLPPELVMLARRAVDAIDGRHPGLPDEWCELAASLAESAGELDRAALCLVECARRSSQRGAFSTAEQALARARGLALPSTRRLVEAELIAVWPHVGKAGAAVDLGVAILDAGDAHGRIDDRLELLNSVAIAALAIGRTAVAASAGTEAMTLAGENDTNPGSLGRAEALSARIAAESGHTAEALNLAESALVRGISIGRADIQCDALDVLARVTADFSERIGYYERCRDVAEAAGLTSRRLLAEFGAATIDAVRGEGDRLRRLRDLAASIGAVDTAAHANLIIADFAMFALDHDTCLDAAQRCVEASRRFGLATLPVGLLWLAGAHAIGGRGDEMEASLAEADLVSGGDPRIAADGFGRVRSIWAFLQGDREGFRSALHQSVVFARQAPSTSSVFAGRVYWLLLQSTDSDDHGDAARAATTDLRFVPVLSNICGWSDAIAAGRSGDTAAATELFERLDGELPLTMRHWGTVQVSRLLAAQAALRDGWGAPVTWLREMEAWFFEHRMERVARDCRSLLGQAGEPVPRRRRGQAPVSPGLRALGITGREVEVLLLLVQHRSNREIADQLFLSVRTVEHHVASLFARTGVRDRARLAEFAAMA